GRHAVRRVCPLLLPWKKHLLGVFVIGNTLFRRCLPSPVCFSARFVIASAPFRHDSSWPVRISGAPCHRQYGFSTLFVISGTLFRVLSADRVDF
ncbi:MAG: hypothetical protein U0N34_06275, partial [Oscillospiraceae bacterium]